MGERHFCVCITTREYVMYDEQGKEYDRKVTKESRLLSSDDTIKETKYGFVDRDTYLQSAEWQFKRQMALQRDHFTCQKCGTAKNLNVHHLTYANFGREKIDDLITLCKNCHEELHKKDIENKQAERKLPPEMLQPTTSELNDYRKYLLSCLIQKTNQQELFFDLCKGASLTPSNFGEYEYVYDTIMALWEETGRCDVESVIKAMEESKTLYKGYAVGKKYLRRLAQEDISKADDITVFTLAHMVKGD